MPDDQFPNASKRKAAEPDIPPEVDQEIERIISSEVITRKPSGFRRLRKSFIAGDATSVGEHVFWNLMIPAAKDALSDTLNTFIDMMIFGEKRQRYGNNFTTPQQGVGSTSKFNYTSISSGKNVVLQPQEQDIQLNPNEIILNTRAEADTVIHRMFEILEKYHVVTVTNLYTLIGKTSKNYMDNAWGWTELDGADVKRVRGGGYLLLLPLPKDINH